VQDIRKNWKNEQDCKHSKTTFLFGTHEGRRVSSWTNLMITYFPYALLLETLGVCGNQLNKSRESAEEGLRGIGLPKKKQK
jgi:hypothetical protein